MTEAIGLSILLVLYNNLTNRWEPFHGSAYVPLNLALTALATAACLLGVGLSAGELGLDGELRDVWVPLGLVAAFGIGALTIASSRHAHRIADRRVEGMRGSALALYVLMRIPLGTAIPEEVLFRGLLFGLWVNAGWSDVRAAVASSFVFGLWHIAPTINAVRANEPDAGTKKIWLAAAGAVFFTFLAGAGFTWLRMWTEGVLAPIVLHAGINSTAAAAAAHAHSRKDPR